MVNIQSVTAENRRRKKKERRTKKNKEETTAAKYNVRIRYAERP